MSLQSAGQTAAGQDKIGGAADVGLYSLQRRIAVAGGDGLARIGVKPDRVALRQPFGVGAQIEIDHRPGLQPERADDFDQDRRVRGLINRKMKGLVEFDRARQIGRGGLALRLHRFFCARDRYKVAAVPMECGLRRGMMETPSTSAADRNDSLSPGASRPEISRSASFA